jgi:tRNA threonylcarbamoyladenosine biosynthesis protein TsaE
MGALVVLVGDLGAGKTTFVQQLAHVLESPASVSSPTYTLIHEYPSPQGLLVHIDAYRLTTGNVVTNLEHLGLDDYLERARCVVVEWGEALLDAYPDAFAVYLEVQDDARHVTIKQHHQRLNHQRLTGLEADVNACIKRALSTSQGQSTEVS